jgi:hypothetical protein
LDSGFWKVVGTFIAVLGAAAIIFQLNQGTLFQTGANTFGSVVGDAFAASSSSPAGTAANGSGSSTTPSGSHITNKSSHSQQFTVT